MSKFLTTAAAVVGAVAIVAAGVATANPGLVIAGTKVATIASIASASAAVLSVGAGVLKPKPSQGGSQTSWRADPQAGIPYPMGRTYLAGNIVYRKAWGKDNQYQTLITVLGGGGPHHAIDQMYVDKQPRAIGGGAVVNIPNYGYMWAGHQLGATPEAVNLFRAPGVPPSWTADCKLSGYAATIVTLKYDTKGVAVDARVTRLAETSANEDAALARLIQQVSARISGLGEVGLEQAFQAVVSRLGKIEGRYTVTIDANGNLNGFQLIGSDAGPGSLNLINTDLRMGSGRIILATPESMLAIGLGFGAQKDLLLWYGPRIALDDCSRSNARMHLPTVGQAYFGGGLSAGKMSTPGETPSLAADAVAAVPWFGSDGRPVQYVCAWSYRSTFERTYPPTAEGRDAYDRDVAAYNATGDQFQSFGQKTVEQPRSTVTLSRTFDGNTYTQLEQVAFTTQRLTFRGIAPSVGDAPGRGTFTTDIGGGFTTRDPVQSTGNRALRLSLSRGFNLGVDGVVQRLSIVAVEE